MRMRRLYAVALPVVAVLLGGWSIMQHTRATGIPWTTDDRHLEWAQLSKLHEWIHTNAEPGSVVMANFDPAVFLYTGHKAVRPYVLDNVGFFYGLRGDLARRESWFRDQIRHNDVRYVLRSGMDLEEMELAYWIEQIRLANGGAIFPVAVLPDEYQIYRIQHDRFVK